MEENHPVVIHSTAYIKLLMHLYKYASDAVCGILLGKVCWEATTATRTIAVHDVVAQSHQCMECNPMIQIGIKLAVKIAQRQQLEIVGCYFGGERWDASGRWDDGYYSSLGTTEDHHHHLEHVFCKWLMDQVAPHSVASLFIVSENRKLVRDVRTSQVPLQCFYASQETQRWKMLKQQMRWTPFTTWTTVVWTRVSNG
ncbi:hypothetical protein GAYE_PCTG52G1262 [Galdieria yellowstonensis]|uniref:MPN domain-containing protein n=1 Tax=Galdieria yellowstonensis TaxID=3028027 RepID=A0AAV9I3T3_9RHOD|nr:hypothetical protein GAYE_PCTG52G1262 [Galdieria yellowstonensis]